MSYFSSIKLITDYIGIPASPELDFVSTYHQVAQSYCKWPVVLNDDGLKLKLFEWGLIADYMNTPETIMKYRNSMVNARSEKLLGDANSIWYKIRKQRCLVFSTGFFEHRDIGQKKKQPYFITLKNTPVFCIAGLYNYSPIPDKETGEMVGTFVIVTRDANELLKKIHNSGENSSRMPVILTKELAKDWLKNDLPDHNMRKILRSEFPSEMIQTWPVNTIRTRKEDNEKVIEELSGFNIPAL